MLARHNPLGLAQLFTRNAWSDLDPLNTAWGDGETVYGVGTPVFNDPASYTVTMSELKGWDIYLLIGSTVIYISKRLGFVPTINQMLSELWRSSHPEGIVSAFDLREPISWPFPKAIQNYSKFSRELLAARDAKVAPMVRQHIAG